MEYFFPYSTIRKGQKEMMDFIYNNLIDKKISIIHAPTGIGKTISSLAPTLKYALENNKKILFLTNRHEHHRIVFETIKEINKKYGLGLKAINIINKRELCNIPAEEIPKDDFHDYCRNLKKDNLCYFYSNTYANGKLTHNAKIALSKAEALYEIKTQTLKETFNEFCPYELSLELAKNANIIIADYYYVFNESIANSFFGKLNLKPKDVVLIIDEAHNLPERIRRMNESKISSYVLTRAYSEIYEHNPSLAKHINEIAINILLYLKNKINIPKKEDETYLDKKEIIDIIEKYIPLNVLLDELYEIAEKTHKKNKRSYANSLRKFLEFWDSDGENIYRIGKIEEKNNNLRWALHIVDVDIRKKARQVFEEVDNAILMSATLTPLSMYQQILGIEDISNTLKLPNIFPQTNVLSYIITGLTTKYEFRNEETYQNYAFVIETLINNINKNIIVFFPSYEIMENIITKVKTDKHKILLIERKDITSHEKNRFLKKMKEKENVVLFAVMGANFYEGVDFKGNTAEVVALVGMPFEKPDLYTKAIIKYYDELFHQGMTYGYIIPSINKILQSSGRIIRSETDKGAILFIDSRYNYPKYKQLIEDKYVSEVSNYENIINLVNMIKIFLGDIELRKATNNNQ